MQGFYILSRLLGYLSFQGPDFKRFGIKRLWLSGIIVFVAVISSGYLLPARSIAVDRQEVIEQRTENTKTFKNSDGTTTIEFSTEPLHYLDDAGTWQDIDTSIIALNISSSSDTMNTMAVDPVSYPQYSVTKNAYKAYFGSTLAEPIRMEWKDKSVEFYPLNYTTPSVSVVKNSITYVDAWKDADLRYIVTPRELKEEIILKTAAVAATYSFLVRTVGVTLVKETDGSMACTTRRRVISFGCCRLPMQKIIR